MLKWLSFNSRCDVVVVADISLINHGGYSQLGEGTFSKWPIMANHNHT